MYKDFYNNKLVPFVNKVRMACNVGEIPLVFDNSLTYYEQIAAFSAKLNNVISTVNVQSLTLCEFMQQLTEAFKELSDDFAAQWADIQAAFVQLSGRVNVLDERVTSLENLPLGVGMAIPEGTEYIEPGEDPYIAGLNAEIFNCYDDTESVNKNRAAGDYSHAEGVSTKAYATASHCEGSRTTALKSSAHAEGMDTTVDGLAAHAGGRASSALDAYAFAHGNVATASGEASVAFGSNTSASGTSSFAEGCETTAVGNYSHAEGYKTTAVGMYTHAEGMSNSAVGNYSHAEGNGNNAVGAYAHAEGNNNTAQGDYSHIEGYGNNITSVAAGAHVEGQDNTAAAINAHAEGYGCYANGNASHCEGYNNHANGIRSHCEGYSSTASGDASHAEGTQCTASAQNAHAGGDSCTASGTCSFVHGTNSTASGGNAGAVGNNLIASGNNQFVCGYNNAEKNSDYLFIVGNGTASRSNAFEVDKYGNIYLNGSTKPFRGATVYDNSDYTITPYSATDPHVDNLNASATGYQIGDLQTVHVMGSYTIYYSVSSDKGYKICDITVPGTIADETIEISAVPCFHQYITDGGYYEFFIARIETIDNVKKLSIYCHSKGIGHGSSGTNKIFDITATFKVSG